MEVVRFVFPHSGLTKPRRARIPPFVFWSWAFLYGILGSLMKKVVQKQICKLCGVKSYLRNSHIYPEFLYKHCYDQIHRAIRFDIDKKSRFYIQQGIREPLLCETCEQHLSRIENRFKIDWYDSGRIPTKLTKDFLSLQGFDYVQFKLFHLSLLWRWSVATRDEFSTVNLGPHEDRLAELIRNEDAGEEWEYRFWGQILVHDDESLAHDIVSRPYRAKLEDRHVYYACFGGCEWTYFVSSHNTAQFKMWCFGSDGSIVLVREPFVESITAKIVAEG